MLLNQI